MIKKRVASVVIALSAGFSIVAHAGVVLGHDTVDIDGSTDKKAAYSLDDSLGFNVKKNGERVEFSVTFDPDKGNKGTVSELNATLQGNGKNAGGMMGLNFNSVSKNKSGDVTYTFFDTLNKGHYTFDDAFNIKNNWKGVVSVQIAAVPEPEIYALIGIGLVGLILSRRKPGASRPIFTPAA